MITELSLPYVSVASAGDEYFEVSFDARPEGTDGDTPYFLLQRGSNLLMRDASTSSATSASCVGTFGSGMPY